MLIKQKSRIVALTSGCIIAAVLVLTLIGYITYTTIKADSFKRRYESALEDIRSR